MAPMHRHQLARLTRAGWREVCRRDWDPAAQACLAHWAAHGLPLVVTRQPQEDDTTPTVAMGLSAPQRWERRRISLRVPLADVLYFDEFPAAERVTRQLPAAVRLPWRRLCAGLRACGVVARVYGSHGWQCISGLDHVHRESDIDLWMAVSSPDQADAATALLRGLPCARLRIDGELVFQGDVAVAWREWLAWRDGRAQALLVKTIQGAALARDPGQLCVAGAVHGAP